MRTWLSLALMAAVSVTAVAADQKTGTLESATEALGADHIRSIEFSGTGKWYLFGQEPNPNETAPEYDVTSYTASIDYNTATSHIQRAAREVIDPTRWRPSASDGGGRGGGQGAQEFVAGGIAWTLGSTGGNATGLPVTAISDAKNAEEHTMEIWATPQGFLRAAAANHATSRPLNGGGSEVTFMMGKHKMIGRINAREPGLSRRLLDRQSDSGGHALRSRVYGIPRLWRSAVSLAYRPHAGWQNAIGAFCVRCKSQRPGSHSSARGNARGHDCAREGDGG